MAMRLSMPSMFHKGAMPARQSAKGMTSKVSSSCGDMAVDLAVLAEGEVEGDAQPLGQTIERPAVLVAEGNIAARHADRQTAHEVGERRIAAPRAHRHRHGHTR